jgi:hypothetical protein
MPKTMHATAISLIVLAAMVAMSASAEAGCTPSTGSSFGGNTCIGDRALVSNTDLGFSNTAIGVNALQANKDGSSNTASGVSVLFANVSGHYNTGNGIFALLGNISGDSNTAIGASALAKNTIGN